MYWNGWCLTNNPINSPRLMLAIAVGDSYAAASAGMIRVSLYYLRRRQLSWFSNEKQRYDHRHHR